MRYCRNITFFLVLFNSFQAFSESIYNINPIQISKDVYVFIGDVNNVNNINGGAISNTGFIIGENSILVIDAGPSYLYASKVIEIIKSYSSLPIKHLIVTHHHPDHSFGISKFIEIKAEIIMSQPETHMYLKYGNRLLRQVKNLIGDDWFIGTNIVKFENSNQKFPLNLDLGGRKVSIELFSQGHSEGDLLIKDMLSNTIFSGDLVFNERAPTVPHANINNWNKYISKLMKSNWSLLVPGHGELIKIKEKLILTKQWINYIDKVAKQAVLNGTSPAEIFNEGIPASLRKYKLAKETWIRDLPLLINKYEFE